MILNNRDSPTDLMLQIGNSYIERTYVHKFLGVHIDENLNFASHASKVSSKISRAIGLVRKLKPIVSKELIRQVHHSFIFSGFTYGIIAYGTSCQSSIGRLSNLVRKSLKIITNEETITTEVCKRHGLYNFELSLKYFICIKMYQVLVLNRHEYFRNKIFSFQVAHSHTTRTSSALNLNTPLFRYVKCQMSFLFVGIKHWNSLPLSLRNIDSLRKFKKELKLHLYLA